MFPFQRFFNEWMATAKVTEADAGRAMGCSPWTVQGYRSGKSLPPNPKVPTLAVVFGIPEADLLNILLRDRAQRARKALHPAEVLP